MPSLAVLVIDRNRLFREAMKLFLDQSAYSVVAELSEIEEAIRYVREHPVDLLIVGEPDWSPEGARRLLDLRSAAPAARTVVLCDEVPGRYLKDALGAAVDGYIRKDVSPRAFAGYLELVVSGERVFPLEFVKGSFGARGSGRTERALLPRGLSWRERDILRLIATGESNKVIARRMHLAEGTVKAHVKSILRKVEVQNRTQAALWAIQNGLVSVRDTEASEV